MGLGQQAEKLGLAQQELVPPVGGFGLGVGFATRDYAISLITGLAISGAIFVLYELDRAFLHPWLERLACDWLHLGLEMTFSLLEHVLGALAALLLLSRPHDRQLRELQFADEV